MDDLMLRRRMMAQKKRQTINIDGTWTGPDNKYDVTISGNTVTVHSTLSYGGMGDFVVDFGRVIFSVPVGSTLTITADPAFGSNDRMSIGASDVTPSFANSFIIMSGGTSHTASNTYVNSGSSSIDAQYMTFRRYHPGTTTFTLGIYLDGEQLL